jgi:formyl-CoA transferase
MWNASPGWGSRSTSAGAIDALLPPASLDGVECAIGDVPDVGEQTEAVLAELGYDRATTDNMRAIGMI